MYDHNYEAVYKPARRSLTSFAVITLILVVITIANAIVCTHNFNKGLKPHISSQQFDSAGEKHQMQEMSPNMVHPLTHRMEID